MNRITLKDFEPVSTGFVSHYTGLLASVIRRLVNDSPAPVVIDQHQQNGMWGVHQMRGKLPADPTTYRIIIAPANAPISVSGIPIDDHFKEPING